MSSSSMPPAEAAIAPPTASDADVPPASASAAQLSLPSNVVAPPPPPPAAVTVAPPPLNNDDAPLKGENAPQENAPPSKGVSPPAVAASSSDGDTGGVDTTIVAAVASQSSHSNSTDMVQPPPTRSLQQRSRRSTANYDQDYSSEGIFTTDEGEEAAFAEGGEEVESSQHHDNDDNRSFNFSSALTEHHNGIIILSMKDPNYKAIMFSSFQKLGAVPKDERDEGEEERVKEEVFHLLKKSGGGRFMNYVNFRSPKEGVVEVDEMAARKKIFNDIYRRLESKAHWAKEEAGAKDISVSAATPRESSTITPRENSQCSTSISTPNNPVMLKENDTPPIILSLKDANYRQVMFAAFQKLGALDSSNRDCNEERKVKDEMYNLFKSTGRKMVIYLNRNVKDGLKEVDEKAARDKIKMDISRRMESQTRWDGVDLPTDMSLLFQEKEAAVDEEEETILGSDDDDGSDYEDDSNSSLHVQASGNDAILSMKNANYKTIMFSFFRQLTAHAVHERDRDEEKRVKNEAFALLKSLGGRMMKYRNRMKPSDGLIEVDEKTARLQIGNDISKRLSSYSDWATEGAFNPHRDGASKKQPAQKNVSVKKKANKGTLVSIRKSATKYSPPTKRVSSYPRRSRNRVTFKDDVQFSVQKTQVAKRARSSASARLSELHSQIDQKVLDTESSLVDDVATTDIRSSSRDYKCRVCGQPKKGHKCTGNPPSWEEESSTEVVHTPLRPLSKSQARRSAMSPKFITPTQDSVVVTSARGRRKRQSGCGECENCQREDCGRCASCKDKVKFGGRGTKRQKCKEKRCLANESLPAQTTNVDNSQFTTPTTSRSSTKRKSAVAANLTIMNVMADEDLENKGPSGEYMIGSDDLVESDLLVKRAKFDSVEEQMPSFEEISASEFNDLIDLLQSSPLPQRKVDTEVDWQGLHLADLSPIPVIPATRVVKLDTTKPIILGPNSAWSQRLIMTEEVTTTPSFRMPKPRTFKSNLREPEPKTSDSQQFESIMSPPNFSRDDYTSIFSEPEDPKLIPYSPIKLLPRSRKLSL